MHPFEGLSRTFGLFIVKKNPWRHLRIALTLSKSFKNEMWPLLYCLFQAVKNSSKMRFNKAELASLAEQPSHKFEKEGILFVRERQEGFFRKTEGSTPCTKIIGLFRYTDMPYFLSELQFLIFDVA